MPHPSRAILTTLLLLAACADPVSGPAADAGAPDASRTTVDASATERGLLDAPSAERGPDAALLVDAALPDGVNPDSANPDSANPDSANPDSANPDSALSDSANPDTRAEDGAAADSSVGDSRTEDSAVVNPARWAICGATHAVSGARLDVEIEAGVIRAVVAAGVSPRCADADAVQASGRWICPAFLDSHVHLAYYPVSAGLAAKGVAAAVDMGAPLSAMRTDTAPLRTLWSGPFITAVGGYPTQGWGAGGYGIEVADVDAASAAVDQVHAAGSAIVKIAFAGGPELSDPQVSAIVSRAHALGLRVAVHVLDNAGALRAAQLGVDLLAHIPTQALSSATLEAWRGRAVIANLTAFSNTATTRANLAALRARELVVLYGTDLGNTRSVGIQTAEVQAMLASGMTLAEVIAASTSAPADYWGLSDLGRLEVGAAASLLLLDADPALDPTTFGRPAQVFLDGATP